MISHILPWLSLFTLKLSITAIGILCFFNCVVSIKAGRNIEVFAVCAARNINDCNFISCESDISPCSKLKLSFVNNS